MRNSIAGMLKFLCGTEEKKGDQVNRVNLFTFITSIVTIVLLVFTFIQINDVRETNSADFAVKLKADIFSVENVTLISLLDENLLKFHPYNTDDGWFALDSACMKDIPKDLVIRGAPGYYTLVQIDQLLQAFERLSFFEQRGQIKMKYIYEEYAYYIQSVWKNEEIQKYIKMTRNQENLCSSYTNFEKLYKEMVVLINDVKCEKK
jgi:hypothetical protein